MGKSGGLGGLLPLLLLILLFVWFVARQRRQQREFVSIQDSVQVGSTVMMASGIYGEVVSISEDGDIEVEVAPGVRTRWRRQAVAKVIGNQVIENQVFESPDRDDSDPTSGSG